MIKVHLLIQLPNSQDAFEKDEDIEDQPRPARPITETTTEHIEEIRCLIDLTIDEIQVETGISCGRIICEYLQLRKTTVAWVGNLFTDAQRIERVRLCQENLTKFHQGTCRLCDVVTGDHSCFYQKQIGRKSSNGALDTNWRNVRLLVARRRVVLLQELDFVYFSKRLLPF